MGMELAREIEAIFEISLDTADLLELTDIQSLIKCVLATLGPSNGSTTNREESEEEEEEHEDSGDKPLDDRHLPQVNDDIGKVNGVMPETNVDCPYVNGAALPSHVEDYIPTSAILETFAETKNATDRFIEECGFSGYAHHVLPKSNELCVVCIVDAFEQLGHPIRLANPGQTLNRIQYLPRHKQFVDFLYDILVKARLVDLDGPIITRTRITVPAKSADALVQEPLREHPEHAYDHKLTYLMSCKLADCLAGKADGLQMIFGTPEGREVASGMYGQSPINVAWITQMEYFLRRSFVNLQSSRVRSRYWKWELVRAVQQQDWCQSSLKRRAISVHRHRPILAAGCSRQKEV